MPSPLYRLVKQGKLIAMFFTLIVAAAITVGSDSDMDQNPMRDTKLSQPFSISKEEIEMLEQLDFLESWDLLENPQLDPEAEYFLGESPEKQRKIK
jgi:hypothetical protein